MEKENRVPDYPRRPGPSRPLGRGLEDVSNFFLSHPAEGAGSPLRPQSQAEPLALLKPGGAPAREQFALFLRSQPSALEPGLRVIDASLACDNYGAVDLLALDSADRLAVVDFETAPSDTLLLRGLSHIDWIVRNTQNLRRMYPGQAINFGHQPRLLLVAPHFSPLVKSAARSLLSHQVIWCRCHFVALPRGTGILFEEPTAE